MSYHDLLRLFAGQQGTHCSQLGVCQECPQICSGIITCPVGYRRQVYIRSQG